MGIYGDRVQTSRSERRSGSFSHKRILSIALDADSFVGQKRSKSALLSEFISAHKELESYKNGKAIKVDGRTLSIPAVTAAARYNASVILDNSSELHQQVDKSREVLQRKLDANKSVYGVSTGFGGSADTRTTRHFALGNALLQHQQSGVLPSSAAVLSSLPLSDPMSSTSMPESWVRGAILIRANSLVRGHSGVRWDLVEKMIALLKENITPLVPLRGSISASGDLSPLSYVAGTLMGNPSIRVFDGPRVFGARQVVSSRKSLKEHGIEPLPLLPKEHLGILNGTAFSASVAALALTEAAHLALLAQVCTAMGTEALLGTMASYVPFIHDVARPHPGQIEAARNILALLKGSKLAVPPEEEEVTIDNDTGVLRQDRYPLRTSPQFIGPQLEDILSALSSVTQELNSTTDNPLVESETGIIHNGGNFQAMAVTNAMEKTRLALHHFGKILFAQTTELINPAMNRGLPPNLAATDPSINYHTKGIDIAAAAYVSELGYLANPVSTHIQSAEMHNQAVNSLALISARHTISSLEILSMLIASYLYSLCQAFDLRAMEALQKKGMEDILREEVSARFGKELALDELDSLSTQLLSIVDRTMWNTSSMDAEERMTAVAGSTTTTIVDFFTSRTSAASPDFASVSEFRAAFASRSSVLSRNLQKEFLSGARGPTPASSYLGKTRAVYEFIRLKLNIKMHGMENLTEFEAGPGVDEVTVGQNVSLIYEAIRDGQMQNVIVNLFDDMGLHHSAPVTLVSPTVRSPVKSQFSGYTASA